MFLQVYNKQVYVYVYIHGLYVMLIVENSLIKKKEQFYFYKEKIRVVKEIIVSIRDKYTL